MQFGSGKFAASSYSPFAAIINAFTEIIKDICQDKHLMETIMECTKRELTVNDRSTLSQFKPPFHLLLDHDDELLGGLSALTQEEDNVIILDRDDVSTKIKFSLHAFLRDTAMTAGAS